MNLDIDLPPAAARALAVALALVPVLAVLAAIYLYFAGVIAHHARVSALTHELDVDRAVVRDAPVWAEERARLHTMAAKGSLVFASPRIETDATDMQSQIAGIVAKGGGSNLQDKIEVKADGEDGPVLILSTLTFDADMAGATKVLYLLKQARPVLVARSLSIAADGAPAGLRVDLVVAGFASPP